ncbi:MAG: DUF4177 domain-containing protein [Acetatifactor sp.]|nr:DUF4177 domain-containing protein [Acetatifactor sp.]
MKTCPNCGELLGDSVDVCIKCRYDYRYRRVITSEELAKQRNRQIEEQQKALEESRLKEEQKKLQLAKNPRFEYKIVIVNDLPNGQIDGDGVQKALDEWAENGWKLHSAISNEIGKDSSSVSIAGFGSGINATIEQTILIFERCIKA